MKIIFSSSEIAPYASAGGLGEVAHSLPRALGRQGVDVVRVMPMYRQVWESGQPMVDTGMRLKIPIGYKLLTAEIWTSRTDDPPVYFIARDEYFDRREVYCLPGRDYDDNFERFVFFQKSVVALIDALDLKPDIVHCNDWTSGLVPLFLKHGLQGLGRPAGSRVASVMTIHNLAYQGIFPAAEFSLTNLPLSCFSIGQAEFYGNINCLKAGIMTADLVTTVSPSYAKEITTPEYGYGLEGVLQSRSDRLHGILNGVEYDLWDPARDSSLVATFTAEDLSPKAICKTHIQKKAGLPERADVPMLAMITRLVDQKGMDLLATAMEDLLAMDVQMVLLGSGQVRFEDLCREWGRRWPTKFHPWIGFDRRLSHEIQAAADIFLMPSRFEPCGLSQLYSLRYAALPVVHATGGLNDTIRNISADRLKGNGIKFEAYTKESFLDSVSRAIDLYGQKKAWHDIVTRNMREDHSWQTSAHDYIRLFEKLINRP